jgi:hypothetical protein
MGDNAMTRDTASRKLTCRVKARVCLHAVPLAALTIAR